MADSRKLVFIMVDTQRKDMLGCYGSPEMHTPNLDRLAGEGVRYENAYCCQPVCGPARAALFTGTYPHSNGGWGNTMPLGSNVKTVGQRLHDQGVHSAYIGKWHLDGGDYFGTGDCPEGWDAEYWYDMRNYLEELSDEDRLRSRQVRTRKDPDLTAGFTFGHRCSNRAIDFIEKHQDEDYLLALSYDEPHHPFVCPASYDQYADAELQRSPNVEDNLADKPEHHRAWSGGAHLEDRSGVRVTNPDLFACNAFVDDEIGRVLNAVRQHAPDALIIYTSDHGDMLGSHSISNKGAVMYDEITNVPFLISWPGHAPAGDVSDSLVSHINVVPTMLDFFGVEASKVLEGRSMLPIFREPKTEVDDVIYTEFGRYEIDHDSFGGFQPIRCAYDGRYKLVVNLLVTDEFYDHREDPDEMVNLIESAEHAAHRNRLHDSLLNWMNETRDPFRGYYWERRPWREDARPATWNYTGMTRQREEDERYEQRQLDYSTGLAMVEATRKK